jgi:phenylacetate-CoA ligase
MYIFRKFVENISFPLIAERDGLKGFREYFTDLQESQQWSIDRIKVKQLEQLKRLLIHAYENTSYYKKLMDEAGFHPSGFSDFSDLGKLPILTKDLIRNNLTDLISTAHGKKQLHSSETGGTTGIKFQFYRDNACLAPKEAALFRFERWTGWEFGERMGLVWPASQDYVGHYSLKARIKNEFYKRQVVFPAAVMDEANIAGYVQLLKKKEPTMIRAFSSPIFEISKFVIDHKIENISLKGIITTGEPLYSHQREMIEKAFQCKVFDSYRCREVGTVAQECDQHQGMHINADGLYLEVSRSGNDVHSLLGEIIITDLWNYGMPLIRYQMGDYGMLSDKSCSCGRNLPMIKQITGRTSDVFYTPEKKIVQGSSLVLYLVDNAPGPLGKVQIIQEKLDHIILRYTPDPPLTSEIKTYQENKVRELFGPGMHLTFEEVKDIPRAESGKYLFAINMIDKNRKKIKE